MFGNFWQKLFEPKAFNQGFLPEADGHKVFFAEYGNPKGKVVLLLSCENLRLFKKVRPGDVMIIKTKLLSYRHGIAKGCGRCYVEDKLVSEATISFTLSESEERQQLIPKMRNI